MNKSKSYIVVVSLIALMLGACDDVSTQKASYIEKGQLDYKSGRYAEALKAFDAAAQLDSSDPQVAFVQAQLLEKLGRRAAAEEKYLELTQSWPKHLDAGLRLGRLYLLNGKPDAALNLAESLLANHKGHAQLLLIRAGAKLGKGQRNEAANDVRKVLVHEPHNVQALVILSSAAEDATEVLQHLRSALKTEPNNSALATLLAQVLANNGDFIGAVDTLKTLIAKEPQQVAHRLRLAALFVQAQKADEALAVLLEAKAGDVNNRMLRQKLLLQVAGQLKGGDQLSKLEGIYREVLSEEVNTAPAHQARLSLVQLLIPQQQYAEAKAVLAKVLQQRPDDLSAFALRGKIALLEGDAKQAIADYLKVLQSRPNLAQIRYELARAYSVNGESEFARDHLHRAVDAEPENLARRFELAEVYARSARPDGAVHQLEEILARSPGNLHALKRLGQIYLQQEDYQDALDTAAEMQRLYPEKGLGFYASGLTYRAEGNVGAALESFEKAMQLDPSASDAVMAWAELQLKMKRPELALKKVRSLLEQASAPAVAYNLHGELLLLLGDAEAARTAFEQAIERFPNQPVPYLNLARIVSAAGDDAKAESLYLKGVAATNDESRLLVALSSHYLKLGHLGKAKELYQAVLERSPESQLAANNLIHLLLQEGSEDGSHLRRAGQLAERLERASQPAFLDTYGWLAHLQGDSARAVQVLEQVLVMTPEVPLFQYHLGAAYLSQGEVERGRQQLQSALASDQDFPGREKAVALLSEAGAETL